MATRQGIGTRMLIIAAGCILLAGALPVGCQIVPKPGDQATAAAALIPVKDPGRVHAWVSGRVQGVGFRNFVKGKADALKLKGWVKNLPDSRVELVAEGPAVDVRKLMEAVGKGPDAARVDKVEQKEEPYTGEFKTFAVQ